MAGARRGGCAHTDEPAAIVGARRLPDAGCFDALYPIETVVLAAIVLQERLTLLQIIGIALAASAVVVSA